MPKLQCPISQSLWDALNLHSRRTGESIAHTVQRALSDALQVEQHTLFQVSTSGALVEGLYQGSVAVETLRQHGDFGLGTFEELDGELIVLDGHFYQARCNGQVLEAPSSAKVPFSVVTHFSPERTVILEKTQSFEDLVDQITPYRSTNNLFFAIRCQGHFDWIKVRTACKTPSGIPLVQAVSTQAEFEFQDIVGTLVGFWTPTYASTINVPGYHLHFISQDRKYGGHLLNLRGQQLELQLQLESDLRVAIPETLEFLQADLTKDPTQPLAFAETDRGVSSPGHQVQ
ncbi:acetolactate decarboxylase [Kovacikia minuta CCNUW1]|uniref:acetolactate decarboxylase n=1 Tax=Kovacikia minuta TaxID=2931930 RepID=UPI001CCB95BF|nr:acetolactate decarboxylase [Kovacikia minuta]UBF28643.1 acetolactate decarboxylase [Kovacikia minuta CCNUW1]